MCWEEEYIEEAVCPCGKGKIIKKNYCDDWNRYKSDNAIIECEECDKKYRVETITHHARLSTDGSWEEQLSGTFRGR